MDLFSTSQSTQFVSCDAPLAARMRPTSLEELVGQTHLLGEGKLLRRQIEADRIGSLIFYGPPGVGKTSIGEVIARTTQKHFTLSNAVTASVADMKRAIEEARTRQHLDKKETILFVDEIHRFNKAQQDVLLPHIENGTILFMGATTHNPFFYINSTLLSRSQLFELKTLTDLEIKEILLKGLKDKQKGLGHFKIEMRDEALLYLAQVCQGDARKALNALEIAVKTTPPSQDGTIVIDLNGVEESVQKKQVRYDQGEDEHYDTASAFIKSIRGSDPDAALYWLAKMLHAGEDPRFIARRLIIAASEDVGNADPRALLMANAALQAIEFVGMPEGRIPLAQAVLYVACAPKSNAAIEAIDRALEEMESQKVLPVPEHLKDAHYNGAKKLGHGKGYLYPHAFEGNYVPQDYLVEERHYYSPSNQGYEQIIQQRLGLWKELKQKKKFEKKSKSSSKS